MTTDTTTVASKARDALGIPAHQPINYVELYDALSCIRFHGKPMHPGVTDDLIDSVNRQVIATVVCCYSVLLRVGKAYKTCMHSTCTQATRRILRVLAPPLDGDTPPTLLRLGLGLLLQTIVSNMEQHAAGVLSQAVCCGFVRASSASINCSQVFGFSLVAFTHCTGTSQQPRMYLYSAHDTTIMPLVVAMGVDIDTWPPYLSNLAFELWEGRPSADAAPTYYVRVLYNDSELRIPGVPLGVLCDLDTFATQVLGPYLLNAHDRSRECTIKFGHDSSQPQAIDAQTGAAVQGI